ncbi:hypothetical protein LK540_14275 [Massilia sp. IC2-278]|uniref:hypothetical protein n=1 Tax=Massilia sp. IC2-278 TaxID=2887200 RepID=UPI001E46A851|nr:hypothetical protein [Massilia sp. IC2-278]MCC2961593.1 hypothetical protein [Massilia sp. IC2-278]
MPRNSPEQELLIDSFDNEIAFGYAYRYQEALNDHLSSLSALAVEVIREAQSDPRFMSLPAPYHDRIQYSVVNTLQRAVQNQDYSLESDTTDNGWRYIPDNWKYQGIVHHLTFQMNAPWMLLEALSARLEKVLPQSVKPFTSFDQIFAVAFEVLDELGMLMRCPVHMPSMATAMHAAFVERHSNSSVKNDPEKLLQNALEHYRNLALQAGIDAIYDEFCKRMFIRFISQARTFQIPIGNYYPWGVLIAPPRSVHRILVDFVSLISEDKIGFGKWSSKNVKAEYLQDTSSVDFLLGSAPKVEPRSASGPIYFSSEHTKLTLEGVPLQNRLIMVLPYDRPFPDLKQALSRFEKYFLSRSATHRADLGDGGAREHERDVRRKKIIPEQKVERVIVERVTSIPMHLAALRSFENDRPEEEGKPKTSLIINIHAELTKFGFDLKRDAIEEALENAVKFRNFVINKLDLWSGRSKRSESNS